MPVTPRAGLPSQDPALELLFADRPCFPGGHFGSGSRAGSQAPVGSRSQGDIHVGRRLDHLDARRPAPAAVKALLAAENAFAPLSAAQEANLQAAGSDKAVFIVTGQQPGLLGGPVLWFHKALTAAALARRESTRLGRPVIPIFWVAGDDSDLAECNHLELLEKLPTGAPDVLHLDFPNDGRPVPVGARALERKSLDRLFLTLASLWNGPAVAASRACYPPGSTLASGFLRVAHAALAEEGMLFLDGFSPRLRAIAQPVLQAAARDWKNLEAALEAGTAGLGALGVKAQVALRPGVVHAFALKGGERHRLFAEKLNGHDRFYFADQPQHEVDPAALELTHDVFTRPLVAEAALPVLGHVLGPAELKYFGQMARLFKDRTGDAPLVHPRMTALAAPETALAALAARGIDAAQTPRLKPSDLKARLSADAWSAHPAARQLSAGPAEAWLPALKPAHEKFFRDAGPLTRLEKSLRAAWKRYHLSLERLAYSERHAEDAPLYAALKWMGNGAGQDRHLNYFSLLNALGPEGLAEYRRALDPLATDVQLLSYP